MAARKKTHEIGIVFEKGDTWKEIKSKVSDVFAIIETGGFTVQTIKVIAVALNKAPARRIVKRPRTQAPPTAAQPE